MDAFHYVRINNSRLEINELSRRHADTHEIISSYKADLGFELSAHAYENSSISNWMNKGIQMILYNES